MIRKFKRDKLRKQVGNRNMKSSWERLQRKKYGRWYKDICKKKKYEFEG